MYTANEKFHARSIELLSLFRNTNLWSAQTEKAQGTLTFLSHHSRSYFSPFRASFLFEMKSLEALSYFSPVLIRDGGMTLLHFFYRHPTPPNPEILLFVHKKLQNLVPIKWRPQVLYYDIKNKQQANLTPLNLKILFLVSAYGERQNSLIYTQNILQKIQKLAQDRPLEISVCPISSQNKEDSSTSDILTAHYTQTVLQIAAATKTTPSMQTVSDLQNKDLSNWNFIDLNEHCFYYGDSFLQHILYLQSAQPLFSDSSTNDSAKKVLTVPLSFSHELHLYELMPNIYAQDLQIALEKFRTTFSLSQEENQHDPEKISFKNKICSSSFEDFAFYWTQKLL